MNYETTSVVERDEETTQCVIDYGTRYEWEVELRENKGDFVLSIDDDLFYEDLRLRRPMPISWPVTTPFITNDPAFRG